MMEYLLYLLLYMHHQLLLILLLITIFLYFYNIFPSKMYMDDLRYYYEHLYPYDAIYKWLTYNQKYPFEHREISFEYEDGGVQRYVKFKNPQQMKRRMTSQVQDPPRKLDAGAIWTGPPAKDNKEYKPLERQLIFDFDMDDYDDVRKCCSGKTTCQLCWKFMLIAKQVITAALSQDFGFNQFMYVFSGGRGMHIWVCDQQARKMPDSLRKSIVDYLQVVTGNSKASSLLADNTIPLNTPKIYKIDPKIARNKQAIKGQLLSQVHPHIRRSLKIIRSWFVQIFTDQTPFTSQSCRQVIYRILQSKSKKLKQRVIERWAKCDQTIQRMWEELCIQIEHYELCTTDNQYPIRPHEIEQRKFQRMTFIQQEIMLSFLYPRMDYNVSTMQNHLLKLPFSIHPSTKKVSVPLFSSQVQKFNPKSCIQLGTLIKQLADLDADKKLSFQSTEENARQTLLGQYLRAMEAFCNNL